MAEALDRLRNCQAKLLSAHGEQAAEIMAEIERAKRLVEVAHKRAEADVAKRDWAETSK